MKRRSGPDWVLGYIDGYGAIHYKKLRCGDSLFHAHYWPMQSHKRWRFNVHNWDLDQSVLSDIKLNDEDGQKVIALMRKILRPPQWVLDGEAREAAGRHHRKTTDKNSSCV